jgi:16S rRNA (guanine966-N2)-methyltransferase
MPRGIRPTQGKVRKAALDTLGVGVEGARCLDLFAGSGAVGLEMLSWGAARVSLVEREPSCVRAIEQSLLRLGPDAAARVRVIREDALRAVPCLAEAGEQFDVVFLDPPYSQGLIESCLQILDEHVIVPPDFRLVAQGLWKEGFPNDFRHFQQEKVVRYGDTALAWYRRR